MVDKLTHLKQQEVVRIHITRVLLVQYDHQEMLYSMGKYSAVM